MAEDCLTHAENKLSSLSLADQDAVSCHDRNSDEYDSNCKNCCSKLDDSNKEEEEGEEKLDHIKETCYSESEDDSGGNFEDTDEQIHKATEGATAPSTDDEYHSADEGDIQVDEELLKNMEETLSDEEKKERQECAQQFKEKGNQEFKVGNFQEAVKLYSKALQTCPLAFSKDRAIMYSNRAAAFMRMQKNKKAIEDSCSALKLNPDYLKALLRRAELYEKEDKLEDALQDYKKIVEMDPSQHSARAACLRLPGQIEERNEKLKAEMMGKLKDLGNMILKPFGLSTDNFQMQKDPQSGSYSVNFKQNVNAT